MSDTPTPQPKRKRGRPRKVKINEAERPIPATFDVNDMLKTSSTVTTSSNSTTNTNNASYIDESLVSQLEQVSVEVQTPTTRKRPRRAASKRAQNNLSQLNLEVLNHGQAMDQQHHTNHEDSDFVMDDGDDVADHDDGDNTDDDDALAQLHDIAIELAGNQDDDYQEDGSTIRKRRTKRASPTKKKTTRKQKKSFTDSISSQSGSATPTSKLSQKGRYVRALKDLSSARDKLERLYGINRDKLLGLAQLKDGFEESVFDFPIENIQRESSYYVDIKPPSTKNCDLTKFQNIPQTDYRIIQEEEFIQIFQHRHERVNVVINDAEASLGNNEKVEFPKLPYYKRTGFVYNLGGLVTDMAWLPSNNSESAPQYLAISLSQYYDEPLNRHLQMFNKEKHISCIEIYQFVPSTLKFSKIQTIVHNFGETWNLKWHEGYNTNICQINHPDMGQGILGLLGFVCQDGSIKFIQIPKVSSSILDTDNNNNNNKDDPIIRYCETASISVSLSTTSISCFDFRSSSTIVCGFKNGYVAEFDLFEKMIPSYYIRVHDSYILSVCNSYSEFENDVINTISVDGYFNLFDPKDIPTTLTNVTRFRGSSLMPFSYIPRLYSMIFADGSNTIRSTVPRACFAIHPIASRETTVASIGTSKLHPMVLSGAADGSIYIDNAARRLLTGAKGISKTLKSLRLWKWDYDQPQDKYVLDYNYQVSTSTANSVSKVKVDFPRINISCIKWNENEVTGKYYAFSNSAGLLTVENLGEGEE
ncbi:transcription factor TFIIIC subunit TFC6 NDAI_0B05580 [Naumovozyma dairenensis CBS 421]|uniref:Uncharacterized protein n=1 Tax=Naumovozyma dairenensis (strain ATCC 10597 / BCRC 20456 / CBS 421 / NBRC 0211 / NRRL Y-12639) TaxID=1071378 RepID=G0W730_NAUDC|nr:hypothetical protein NDAI_0B05580 [Naumovozyma dairenensis CBS 421]CCD23591.1 hypothetical protein NDAI_0B05580 [Naumovozyma dairenensis CBS 421]